MVLRIEAAIADPRGILEGIAAVNIGELDAAFWKSDPAWPLGVS